MTDVPDPQPPAPEASVDVDELEKTVEEGLYADWRSPRKKAAGAALDALAARLREAERERDEARRAMQYYCGRAQDAERERDDLFHAFHKARALLGSGEDKERSKDGS